MGMMYLDADNSSIDCRGTLAIHSYSQLNDLLRCNLKQAHAMWSIHLNLPKKCYPYKFATTNSKFVLICRFITSGIIGACTASLVIHSQDNICWQIQMYWQHVMCLF